jgi:aminopeptidase N
LISKVHLSFDLDESDTTVVSQCDMLVTSNSKTSGTFEDLVLDGEELELVHAKINDAILSSEQYKIDGAKLIIFGSALAELVAKDAGNFQLETSVKIKPDKNLALSGLYKSGTSQLLCTQCEAMGFRRIAYHFDRPDVLSTYTVRLEGDKAKFPLLLSNGNQIDSGEVAGTNGARHWAMWEDPFPKPSYLFALVAGDLGSIHSTYTTTSGRVVKLGIYSDKENEDKLDFAMYSIKESMKWDEDTFGLECDLDIYNIVATNDFNMGAMENKGLNIFNSAYVLADPSTATDTDYERILGVIGHEYFHNWSGNRVTVRDWFQLTLKEGLTVFRDQWFSSDMTSHAVKRIEDVRGLRSRQFAEDAGPLSHPIRPESYISMDNFYTGTVYSKGAEIVGMYRTLLGEDGFKKGLKLYFDRHDGSAVTCDDFRNAMADANEVDLTQMDRWYSQAGTPMVTVEQAYDPSSQRLTLTLHQSTPTTPNQPTESKQPLLIPVALGLLHPVTGEAMTEACAPDTVLRLQEATQTFTFENVPADPVLSIFRGFSSPVNVKIEQTDEQLLFLMAYDTDSFNKWDAGSRYMSKMIISIAEGEGDIGAQPLPPALIDALRNVLSKVGEMDPSLVAYALQLPDETTLLNNMKEMNIDRLHLTRAYVKRSIASALAPELRQVYASLSAGSLPEDKYQFTAGEVGRRRLRNTCLDFLSTGPGSAEGVVLAKQQFDGANCMSDRLSALASLAGKGPACVESVEALASFYTQAAGNALVLNKWFGIQASADYAGLLDQVKALKSHPDFVISNPNRARSLIGAFMGNLYHFHASDGAGYRFMRECIVELDKLNPQVAARMAGCFSQWKRFDSSRRELMQGELKAILETKALSKDTLEVVTRCLS